MFPAPPENDPARAPRRPRILAQIGATVFTLLASAATFAQGVSYGVVIDAPRPLEELLEENLDLLRWQDNPRLDIPQLQRLVKAVPEQARTLIATEGYYSPRIEARLDTSGTVPVARVSVDPGVPVTVGDVDLVLKGFEPVGEKAKPFDSRELRNSWTLPVGSRFRQEDWEAAKRNLLRKVMQTRYPQAQLVETTAVVDPDVNRALLRVVIDSGPEVRFGELKIEGLERYPRSIITNINPIEPGDVYSAATMQAFQARLQDTGYFSGVEVTTDMRKKLDEDLDKVAEKAADAAAGDPPPPVVPAPPPENPVTLPVLVRVTENKQKNVSAGIGVSSNTGYRAQLSYDDLNVYGLRMKSDIVVETKRQSARADFYFPTTAKGYKDSFGAAFERKDLAGEVTAVSNVAVRRSWGSPLLERSLTFEYLNENRSLPGQADRRTQSLPLTYAITKRALDNLIVPTKGYVINAQLGGALLPLLTDERFIRANARFIYYRPTGPSGTLVLRGEAGALGSKEKEGVPEAFLFRAGGDQSVRGYGFQELGVRQGEATVGGRYLLTGGAEYQYWFKPPWGVAFFVDAGNAADSVKELKPKLGYGIGARWRSPVGPINVDIAYGQAVKKARLHFSLGFTF